MLDRRVDRLEEDVRRIEGKLDALIEAINLMRIEMAELKGRVEGIQEQLKMVPTTVQLLTLIFATWAAGAGFLFLAVRYAGQ